MHGALLRVADIHPVTEAISRLLSGIEGRLPSRIIAPAHLRAPEGRSKRARRAAVGTIPLLGAT